MPDNININKILAGYNKISYCDWPQKISSILFTTGCNLRCPTCHNWQIAYGDNINNNSLDIDEIITYVNSKKSWIDGLVISGGEPLMHKDALISLCDYIKSKSDILLKLDTNGTYPSHLKEIISEKVIDIVAMDVKGPFTAYPKLVGSIKAPEYFENLIKESISVIVDTKTNAYFRTTLVPEVFNNKSYMDVIKSYIPSGYKHRIQAYDATNIKPAKSIN